MSTPSLAPARTDPRAAWRHIFAGLCASLVGIGLARFGYTPLIPPLIEAHWFAAADVVTLGAANLAGVIGKFNNISPVQDIDDDDFDFIMQVNVYGLLNCMRAQIPHLEEPSSSM